MNSQPHTNRLIHEKSPYLIQHAHNPVHWYPWSEEALNKAKEEKKLLLVSIGYSSCHWCHVMAHESFEDPDVAKIMNDNFISLKIDREERPDLDQIYMDAVQMITGSGGWPLNCFALPDGTPVYGGTYFHKENWIRILLGISELYKNNPLQLIDQAYQLKEGIIQNSIISQKSELIEELIDQSEVLRNIAGRFDIVHGGLKPAPKFPMPVVFHYLLDYYFFNRNDNLLSQILLTLDQMAAGGIYDQLGGGFSRYSTDEKWFAPHFEKMLYDNAQLISLYSQAFRLTKNENYRRIAIESMDFIINTMLSPQGGFYSALDADSEGREGTYYTWKLKEIDSLLGDKANLFSEFFGFTEDGNWENGLNILSIFKNEYELSQLYNISPEVVNEKIRECKRILYEYRSHRIQPELDNKIIASWNGLMIIACVNVYKASYQNSYLDVAVKCGNFILSELININKLNRIWTDNHNTEGFLDDYANVISAFIILYEQTFDEKWLFSARELTEYVFAHFYDTVSKLFFYQSDQTPVLITRKIVTDDNVTPSPNSVMAENLYLLSVYFGNSNYETKAKAMIGAICKQALKYSSYYANWARISQMMNHSPDEFVIVGMDAFSKMKELNSSYRADIIVAGSINKSSLPLLKDRYIEGKTYIYVCRNNTCKLPVQNISEALDLMRT